ncbi:MAG: methionine ABC transporter substrate-binding protein [Treponema sp.]|jgi:D-methionine transport system substrate-binding protein|nr:methionine ABC transporter substrate-binding protein [Treponema sp.]
MKKLSALSVLAIVSIGMLVSPVFAAGNKEGGAEAAKSGNGRTRLVVQADIVPHAELLEFVKPKLAAEGIDIEINTRTDSSLANEQVDKGELDANFFQHEPYLKSIVAERHFDLANAGNIHVEPIGAYSEKYASVDQVPPNATIAIPNDATNEYRALRILEKAGFITLKQGIDVYQTTVTNTVDRYLKPVTLRELDSALILRVRQDFDVYITNTNKVLEAGLDATKALFREGADSPYANIIAVKSGRVNDPAIKILVSTLRSEDVRTFIESKYKGAVIPAF